MWSSTRPRVATCLVSALLKRSWTPGRSTIGPLARLPALPPKVFTYQAWAFGLFDIGLVNPVVVAGKNLHPRRLPLRNALLNVVDDEADMVHHRALGAAFSFFGPEVQIDIQPWEHDQRVSAGVVEFAAHGKE